MKILKGDKVKILIGKDKGREGLVIKSFPKKLKKSPLNNFQINRQAIIGKAIR